MEETNEINELDRNRMAWHRAKPDVHIKGDLFGVGRRTLLEIGELKSKEIFCISFHTGKIIQRFVRLAMDSGMGLSEIERIIEAAYLCPRGVMSFLQEYMISGRM